MYDYNEKKYFFKEGGPHLKNMADIERYHPENCHLPKKDELVFFSWLDKKFSLLFSHWSINENKQKYTVNK